jgi:hypothetical protein
MRAKQSLNITTSKAIKQRISVQDSPARDIVSLLYGLRMDSSMLAAGCTVSGSVISSAPNAEDGVFGPPQSAHFDGAAIMLPREFRDFDHSLHDMLGCSDNLLGGPNHILADFDGLRDLDDLGSTDDIGDCFNTKMLCVENNVDDAFAEFNYMPASYQQSQPSLADDESAIEALKKRNLSLLAMNDCYQSRISELEASEQQAARDARDAREKEAMKSELEAAKKKMEWMEATLSSIQAGSGSSGG